MIFTLMRISLLTLCRDKVALALTFLLPLVFFSVFALVFSGLDEGGSARIRTLLLLEEETSRTERLRALLEQNPDIELVKFTPQDQTLSSEDLKVWIRQGRADVGVLVPTGFSKSLGNPTQDVPEITLFMDKANPMAGPLVQGLLQSAALSLVIESMTPQSEAVDATAKGLIRFAIPATTDANEKKPSVAFFAAGIGVMFLLFSVSGRSAILIEERESGVLTRLLASHVSLVTFLLGRWLFLLGLGFFQVSLMFVWAALVFGLDLWTPRHLAGFACLTLVTAAAAAALGILLAVSCRTRNQLNGLASVLILVMSAVGGSMFPRFLMPEHMQQLGRITFNAWALDGYQKVFWYEALPKELLLELGVLSGSCLLFLFLALQIARKKVMS